MGKVCHKFHYPRALDTVFGRDNTDMIQVFR